MFAAANNRVAAIRALLAKGADPKATSKTIDVGHELALDRAALALQKKILESGKIPPKDPAPADNSLTPGFDPEEINPPVAFKGGLTALLHAARQGNLAAVEALVEGGAP